MAIATTEKGTLEKLTTQIFPDAVKARAFGADVTKFVSFDVQNQKCTTDQFGSSVVFGDVTVENSTGKRSIQAVVIKTQRVPCVFGDDPSLLFHNEVLFYTSVIPSLRKYDKDGFLTTCFPEFVYGKATNGEHPEEDMVILKNLNQKGFRLSEERLHLDEKHIKLTLDRMGKFHALSLAYQMDDPEGFNQLVSQTQIICFIDSIINLVSKEVFTNMLRRGVEPLKNDPKYKDRLSDLCKNLDNATEHWKKYMLPSKPLTVLSHGDFHRNNLMFTYGADGDPMEVVFFDFQCIVACSPAVDISTFLFMNATPKVRNSGSDTFLRTYYGALTRQLAGYSKKPSFEEVELELRKKGILGYYISSIGIPWMMSLIGGANVPGSNIEWESMGHEQSKEFMQTGALENGGKIATELLVGIVKYMLDKNYIFDP